MLPLCSWQLKQNSVSATSVTLHGPNRRGKMISEVPEIGGWHCHDKDATEMPLRCMHPMWECLGSSPSSASSSHVLLMPPLGAWRLCQPCGFVSVGLSSSSLILAQLQVLRAYEEQISRWKIFLTPLFLPAPCILSFLKPSLHFSNKMEIYNF